MTGLGKWLDLKGKEEEEARADTFIKFREVNELCYSKTKYSVIQTECDSFRITP